MISHVSKTLGVVAIVMAATIATIMSVSSVSAAGESFTLGPVIELPANADKCIRPTEFMRKNHMNLLNHKRDQTTRQGIRTKDASLQGCVDCHSKKDEKGTAIPVNDEGQFCSTCHEYTAVKLDCFECHRTTPDTPASTAAIPSIPVHADLLARNSIEMNALRSYLEEAN